VTHDRVFVAGLVLWVAVFLACWPDALSFADEVGYVGQAKVLLRGEVSPEPLDPGMWVTAPHGRTGRYPLTLPLLLAPWLAITPRAAFGLGLCAAVAMTLWASRLLQAWGRSPAWALLLLAHPTLVLMSRTIMADVVFAACTIGAWLALRQRRALPALLVFALLSCIKPIGCVVSGALLAGEAARIWRVERDRSGALLKLAPAAIGSALGVCALLGMNVVSTGSWRFGYAFVPAIDVPTFSLSHVPINLRSYGPAFLLSPPLLVLGAIPLWRRRELGALGVVGTLGGLMLCYFFVDRGNTWLETIVLAPRLLLPVVSVLVVGYADLLAGLTGEPSERRWIGALLVAATLSSELAVTLVHVRWQRPMAQALATAAPIVDREGAGELALTWSAEKLGLLYDGRTVTYDARAHQAVVLCSTVSTSHRATKRSMACAYEGYRVAAEGEGFRVLVRE
jgi:hypothetical protein